MTLPTLNSIRFLQPSGLRFGDATLFGKKTLMRRWLVLALGSPALALFLARPAWALDCPPGDWFCEPAPPPSGENSEVQEEPPGAEALPPPRVGPRLRTEPPPAPRPRGVRRRWALDIHGFAALLGERTSHSDAGMGGLGFGVRFLPIRHLALDASLELAFGNDYNGDERREAGLLFNAVGILSPQTRIQPFILAGFHISRAEVERYSSKLPFARHEEHYDYFGMQIGAGIEGRISRRASLRFDLIGFVRGRTDDDRRSGPEFIDPDTGEGTNTSGGALLRVGGLFYW